MTKENKRMPCQVYSRIVGYLRPTSSWNDAKKQEFSDRELFDKERFLDETRKAKHS